MRDIVLLFYVRISENAFALDKQFFFYGGGFKNFYAGAERQQLFNQNISAVNGGRSGVLQSFFAYRVGAQPFFYFAEYRGREFYFEIDGGYVVEYSGKLVVHVSFAAGKNLVGFDY